jgi:hypothetical protein
MANLYAPVIANNQRNSNTSVQASTLQSTSNLHNQLSLQSFRTVQGYIYFPTSSGTGVVVNQYDLSPLSFDCGDIVVAMSVSNGSSSYPNSQLPTPFTSGQQESSSVQFVISEHPIYNNSVGWLAGTGSYNLSNSIDPTDLGDAPPSMSTNPPVSLRVTLTSNAVNGIATQSNTYPKSQWLNCVYSNIVPSATDPMTNTTMAINVTLLVINSSIAQ